MIAFQWSQNYQKLSITKVLISKPKILNESIYKKALGEINGLNLNLMNLKQSYQNPL